MVWELGMAARPIENAFKEHMRYPGRNLEPFSKGDCFVQRKVRQDDRASDIEGRRTDIADQVEGGSGSSETKGQALEGGFGSAPIIACTDTNEEFICSLRKERKLLHKINLVDDDDQLFAGSRQSHCDDRIYPPLQ